MHKWIVLENFKIYIKIDVETKYVGAVLISVYFF